MIKFFQDLAALAEYAETALIVVMTCLVLKAFISISRRPDGSAVWYLATSFIVLSYSVMGRMAYWTYMPLEFRVMIGRSIPNAIFGALMIWGLYKVLKFLLLIIPDIERDAYSIWSAPWYPHGREWRMERVLQILRRRKEK